MTLKTPFLTLLILALINRIVNAQIDPIIRENVTHSNLNNCPIFESIENGFATLKNDGNDDYLEIICEEEYDLEGPTIVYCLGGAWAMSAHPRCVKRCRNPPYVKNGALEIEGKKDSIGLYPKGSLATYSCIEGFTLYPKESQYRVCERGIWTGPLATCVKKITNCPSPKELKNGYFVSERPDSENFSVGQRVHYSCNDGFTLQGTAVQQCLENGTWSPKISPNCAYANSVISRYEDEYPCRVLNIPNSFTTVIQGNEGSGGFSPHSAIEIHCNLGYRNSRAPCQISRLKCTNGKWIGSRPDCLPIVGCFNPPLVKYSTTVSLVPPSFEGAVIPTGYPMESKISYSCLPGYMLQGNDILSCKSNGCWFPSNPPSCVPITSNGGLFVGVSNNLDAMLLSAATGATVMVVLIVICLIVVCKKRKPLARTVTIPPPTQRADLGDHAALLHHPDRLALIAFADELQNDQASLPSYEEATRERGPGLTVNRLHRPHWPNLVGRRARNSPNPDSGHGTRHGSFASHTPSTRSAGDSMGSTDTVAISEGSTNITLDTASSHSGSQPASCRAHCGSLASFDTSSVVNTEDVPLLEERELEEIEGVGGDNHSIITDNPSVNDNGSFKLSINSVEIA